tara:strand:+ start:398 stop:820 length:423 start_codon:yes stop_codon:yes gene_type:complete
LSERNPDILAAIGRLAQAGQLPPSQTELVELLVASGFERDEVLAALRLPAVPPGSAGGAGLPVAQLSEDATRFLTVLRSVGYLDDLSEEFVMDLAMAENSGKIGLDEIRRHVAVVMFDRQAEMDVETLRFLQEEWRLVFH